MLDFLFIHWDADPQVFGLPFRWYGISWALSFYLGYRFFANVINADKLPEGWTESLTIYVAVGAVIGARLGNCFFYDPVYYLQNPLEILMIWKGGLASHGAAIGIITAAWLWSRRVSKYSMFWLLDRVVIMVALGGFLVRMGNLMNSEILGKPTDVPWAFVFPQDDQNGNNLQAKWVGEDVELSYLAPKARYDQQYGVMRTYDDVNFTLLENTFAVPGNRGSDKAFKQRDRTATKSAVVRYMTTYRASEHTIQFYDPDTLSSRKAVFTHDYLPAVVDIKAQWASDSATFTFDLKPQTARGTELLYLFAEKENNTYELLKLAEVGLSVGTTFSFKVATDKDARVRYRFFRKISETSLIARHPAQLYEAICYLFIFLFLYFDFRRRQRRIPLGLYFGYFLVLIFGVRIVVEFIKEGFVDSLAGAPLNMGQILSIPLVAAGVFFIIRSRRQSDAQPPNPETADGAATE